MYLTDDNLFRDDTERRITDFLDRVNRDESLVSEDWEALEDLKPFSIDEWNLIDNFNNRVDDEWRVFDTD